MSFILDENQQAHLLVILNDINRHIYEATVALSVAASASGHSPGSSTATTSTSTSSSSSTSPIKLKTGQLTRHLKRPQAEQQQHQPQPPPPVPEMITGFNHANRQNLADFVLNTNRYFKGFFKFTALLIGNDNQNLAPGSSSTGKGKSVLLWLSRFYNKILFEHLNFEQIFDHPVGGDQNQNSQQQPSTTASTSSSSSTSDHQTSALPFKKSNRLLHLDNTAKQEQQQQHLLNGGQSSNVATVVTTSINNPVSSVSSITQQQQQQTGPSNGQSGLSLKQEDPHDLMNAARHLHEMANQNPNQQQQQQQLQYLSHLNATESQQQQSSPHPSHQDLELFNVHQQALDSAAAAAQHQQTSLLFAQILKDLTFLILLIIYLFYKLRHIFPSLAGRFDDSWKFFTDFERELDPSFLHEHFLEFLQLELGSQKSANEKRTEGLRAEVAHLEKMSKIVEKEIEQEIGRLVMLQGRSSKGQSGSSGHYGPSITGGTSVGRLSGSSATSLTMLDLKNIKGVGVSGPQSSVPLGISLQHLQSQGHHGHQQAPSSPSPGGGRPCPECGKVFRNAYKLNRHLFVHKDPSEKPFLCEWAGCVYRSISRNDLNRHRMIHTGEKPYLCDVGGCEKRYSRPDKLRHHKQTIHFKEVSVKKETHQCVYSGCNYVCLSKSELSRHQAAHEKETEAKIIALKTAVLQATPAGTTTVISGNQNTNQHLALGHQQQQQQHLGQQQQQQQHSGQATLSVPLSMLGNHSGTSGGNVPSLLSHASLGLPGSLVSESRLAEAAAAAVQQAHHHQHQQQQQQQQANQNSHLMSGDGSGQVIVVPGSLSGHSSLTTITSVPISAVVSSVGNVPVAVSGQQQQQAQQQQQQRLNAPISVWSA